MKKNVIALPLVALALIGMTGCTAVVVPDEPQATVTLGPQADAGTPTASAPADDQVEQPEQTEQPAESQNSTLDLDAGDEGSEGTRYYMAAQKFSPTIDSWLIDGEKAHFTQYDCTGAVAAKGTGTLEPYGEENGYWLEWDPGISAMDTQMVGTTFEITDEYLAQANGASNAATPDKAGEAAEFAQMCGGLLDVVL